MSVFGSSVCLRGKEGQKGSALGELATWRRQSIRLMASGNFCKLQLHACCGGLSHKCEYLRIVWELALMLIVLRIATATTRRGESSRVDLRQGSKQHKSLNTWQHLNADNHMIKLDD